MLTMTETALAQEPETALLAEPTAILRPGMEGVGKIDAGRRKQIWIWTHKISSWLRMFFWSWWP